MKPIPHHQHRHEVSIFILKMSNFFFILYGQIYIYIYINNQSSGIKGKKESNFFYSILSTRLSSFSFIPFYVFYRPVGSFEYRKMG